MRRVLPSGNGNRMNRLFNNVTDKTSERSSIIDGSHSSRFDLSLKTFFFFVTKITIIYITYYILQYHIAIFIANSITMQFLYFIFCILY